MDTPELIRKKRDGLVLSRAEIFDFVARYTRAEIPDYQASALLMAIYFRDMDRRETADLTEAMLRSGRVLDFSALPAAKVDKHSTGGVGDKTSLIIAPAAAAAGVLVPMISGRGLGHTGGTLDKLEAIPGFNPRLSFQEFHRVLGACGLAFGAATGEFAPADQKLYALRDVTATVESIPLITASIMSKKLAEGIDALVLDVKTGAGAFMPRLESARALATSLVNTGAAHGKRVHALITDMSQPLGNAVGNALEVIESVETLKGRGPRDLVELCRELAAHMLLLGNVAGSLDEAQAQFDHAIASGQALERFARVVAEQGGNPRVLDDYSLLPQAQYEDSVVAPEDGYIAGLEARVMGVASMILGAGRDRSDATIDPGVGLVFEKKVGDAVRAGERICNLYSNDRSRVPWALDIIREAIAISSDPVSPPPLVLERVLHSEGAVTPAERIVEL
jgi:pyrimidine-nucleoside phosphorylase/thymidine phosphorylase